MPPQSFFVARGRKKKFFDYCDDTGKTDAQIVKVRILLKLFVYPALFQEVLDFCVYTNVEPERERLIAHSIQTWRMFHRQETKPGFWLVFKRLFLVD